MPRPSRQTDRALIEAGKRLLPEHGITGLSIRQVSEEAGVNLGMFHYHFKTKEQFARAVLQEVYEEFFSVFSERFEETSADPDPLNRLRALIETIARFVQPNRGILTSVIRDLLSGETLLFEFFRKNAPRHVNPMLEVLKDCRKKKLIRTDMTLFQTVTQVILGIGGPIFAGAALERVAGHIVPKQIINELTDEKQIAKRIDFVIAGLRGGT